MKDGMITYDDLKQLPEGLPVDLIDGVIYEREFPGTQHQLLLGFLSRKIYDCLQEDSWKLIPRPFDIEIDGTEYTVVQPDLSLFCDCQKLTAEKGIGAPDWIIEVVSPFSGVLDYLIKLKKYMESGVREYWIVDPVRDTIRKYRLQTDGLNYETYDFNSSVNSEICPDLWIDFSIWKRKNLPAFV